MEDSIAIEDLLLEKLEFVMSRPSDSTRRFPSSDSRLIIKEYAFSEDSWNGSAVDSNGPTVGCFASNKLRVYNLSHCGLGDVEIAPSDIFVITRTRSANWRRDLLVGEISIDESETGFDCGYSFSLDEGVVVDESGVVNRDLSDCQFNCALTSCPVSHKRAVVHST